MLKICCIFGVPTDSSSYVGLSIKMRLNNLALWIGFVFLCEVKDTVPIAQEEETKDVRWMKKSELKLIFDTKPESIFTLQLGVLDYYFNNT